MKWRRISAFLMISVLLPMISIHAEGTETDFQLSLKDPVKGMTFGLYEDAKCENPLTNAQGETILLVTDEKGRAEAMVSRNIFYLKQTGTVPGWYMEEEVHAVSEDHLELEPHPVKYEFAEMKNEKPVSAHLQIMDEKKEMIADWRTDQFSAPHFQNETVHLEAGKSYMLKDPDIRQWETVEAVHFQIPVFYKEDHEEKAELIRKNYGRAVWQAVDPEGRPVSDVSMQVFMDEAGTKPAEDIHGRSELMSSDAKGQIRLDLYPGTYYAKIQDLDAGYYRDTRLWPCSVKAHEKKEAEITLQPVMVSLSMKSPDGTKLDGTMLLKGEGKEWKIAPSAVHLKRGQAYVLKDLSHPAGYHAAPDLSFSLSDNAGRPVEQSLVPEPFAVNGVIRDEETGEAVKGSLFQILDESGKEVLRFMNGTLHTSRLRDDSVYTIHCLSMPKNYLIPADQPLQIGTEGNTVFTISCTSYVTVSLHPVDAVDRKQLAGIRLSLYRDPECKEILKDLNGHEIREISQAVNVANGTYYGQITAEDPRYYPDRGVYQIQADHAVNPSCVLYASLTRADRQIAVLNAEGKPVSDTEIAVLDENGSVIGSFVSSGRDRLSSIRLTEDLLPGREIYLEIRKAPGLYTWQDRRTKVSIPTERPEEMPETVLRLNPYVSLDVLEADENGKTKGSTYALFEDADCRYPATDIYQKKAEGMTDQEGKIHWNLRAGTYWLKETRNAGRAYLNEIPVRIDLDPKKSWQEEQHFATVYPRLQFTTADSQGSPVAGGSYEIRDENGKMVYSFQAAGTVILEGEWLKPGKTLVIHESAPAAGFIRQAADIRYTLSRAVPDKIPEIRIHCLRQAARADSSALRSEHEGRKAEKTFPWMIPFAAVVLLLLLAALKTISRKGEK